MADSHAGRHRGAGDGAPAHRPQLSVVPATAVPGTAPLGVLDAALELVETLCARATVAQGLLPAAEHADVAMALRALLPLLDDAEFDQHLGRIDLLARRISITEAAAANDVDAYADAAREASLDLSDFPAAAGEWDDGPVYVDVNAFHAAVIAHWDLELRREVLDMVGPAADDRDAPKRGAAYAG